MGALHACMCRTSLGDGAVRDMSVCVCALQVGRRAADEEFNLPEAASTTYL